MGDGKDLGKIDRGDAGVGDTFGEGDAPDAGACGDIEDFEMAIVGGKFFHQFFGEGLGGGETHVEDILDELAEEFGALVFMVDHRRGFAGAHDFGELTPVVQKLGREMLDEAAEIAGFGGDHESGGVGSETETITTANQKTEADQGFGEREGSTFGTLHGGGQFIQSLRTGIKNVEQAVLDGGVKHQHGGETPGQFGNPLGSDRGFGGFGFGFFLFDF